jgi:hypothetical protein
MWTLSRHKPPERASVTSGEHRPWPKLVAGHRLDEDEAVDTIHDLVVTNPRRAFEL